MDGRTLCDALHYMDLQDAVFYLRMCDYDYAQDDHVQELAQVMYPKIRSRAEAHLVARAIADIIPDGDVLASEYSIIHQRYMTMMDAIAEDTIQDLGKLLLLEALAWAGFRYSRECSPTYLHGQLLERHASPEFMTYDYQALREQKEVLHEMLIRYLFSPKKIETWIAAGREPEDYLS